MRTSRQGFKFNRLGARLKDHALKIGGMESEEPDWYLREWAALRGKRQAGLVTDLGWTKNTAHRIWHSKQPYRRDIVNALARWLDIQPFELLMRPGDALALRRFRETAAQVVAENDQTPFVHDDPAVTAPRRSRSAR